SLQTTTVVIKPTLDPSSAFYYAYNTVANHFDKIFTLTCAPHIEAFYSKSREIYPLYCILLQLFKNIMIVLHSLRGFINFNDTFIESSANTTTFIDAANKKIDELFFSKAPVNDKGMFILYVNKKTCEDAWLYYEYLFNISTTLFDTDELTIKDIRENNQLLIDHEAKKILEYPANIFSLSVMTGYDHDLSKNGPFFKKPERFELCLSELIKNGLILEGRYLNNCQRSFVKVIPPSHDQVEFEAKLRRFGVNLNDYIQLYHNSSKTKLFALPGAQFMALHYKQYVGEYYKYVDDLFMKQEIELLLEADLIQEQIVSDVNNNIILLASPRTPQPTQSPTDETVQENQSCTNSPVRMQFNSNQVNDGDIPTKEDSGTILEQLVHMIHESLMTHHDEQHTSTEILTQQQRTDEVTAVGSEKEAKNFTIEEYNNMTESSMMMVDQQYHITTLAPVDEERITVVRKNSDKENADRKKIMAVCQKILETKSLLMTDTDISKITSHYGIQNRTAAKNKLIEQQLIKKDLYLATANKTGNSIKTCPGYVKCFPLSNSITEKEQFSQHLAEYGIKLQDYLKLCEDNKQIRTDTNYGLSELAETLFKSERYREYVSFDEKTVVRPKVISMSCNLSDTTVDIFSTN
ncbi:unnamed protein product, partial [Didymodactylos carnosus]